MTHILYERPLSGYYATTLREILERGGNYINSRDDSNICTVLDDSLRSFTDDQMFRFIEDVNSLDDDYIRSRVITDSAECLLLRRGEVEYSKIYAPMLWSGFPFPTPYNNMVTRDIIICDTATWDHIHLAVDTMRDMHKPFNFHCKDGIYVKPRCGGSILLMRTNWVAGIFEYDSLTQKIYDMLSDMPSIRK